MTDKVKLQLGDIIEIFAPSDTDIHQHTFYISYIDSDKIRLEEAAGTETILTLTNGNLDNESIESITIKSRAEESGYARQNNLLIGVWIDVFFGGDLPLTITGKISNLEEDKIEITTYPEKDVIFLDFGYKGLPEDLPIEKIQIRKAPEVSIEEKNLVQAQQVQVQAQQVQAELLQDEGKYKDLNLSEMEQLRKNMQQELLENPEDKYKDLSLAQMENLRKNMQQELFEIPEDEFVDENLEAEHQTQLQDQLRTLIFNADQIHFGEDLEAVTQMIDVPVEEQRYDIDKQLDDLLDDMLSTIPNAQRTDSVKNDIHKMISRFKEMRTIFSNFDDQGNVLMPKTRGSNYKPLVETMEKLEKQLYWILPVTKIFKKIYDNDNAGGEEGEEETGVEMGSEDSSNILFSDDKEAEQNVVKMYEQNDTANEANKYVFLQKQLNPFLTPFLPLNDTQDIITQKSVNTTITGIVDNLGDFISSVKGNDTYTSPHRTNKYERVRPQYKKRFSLQTYNPGSSMLDMTKVRGDNPIIKRKKITMDDTIDVKSILMLQEPTLRFSRINLQTSTILDKSNLNKSFLNYWQLLKAKTHVNKTTITDLENPHQTDAETFLKNVRNYVLDVDIGAGASDTKYNKFLDAIIPKTRALFDLIKPYLVGKLSTNDILSYLEPFMIYQSDLTFIQQKEMNEFIREKIQDYRKNYMAKSREYGNIKGTQNIMLPSLIKILDENPNLRTKVLDVYGFTDTIMQMSNSDFIKRIIDIDNGIFYNNAIALISTSLMIADGTRDMTDIEMYLNNADAVDLGKKKTAKTKTTKAATMKEPSAAAAAASDSKCSAIKVIAKRYIELDEMLEDNGKETFFDKKYDSTAYDIGEKFKADSNMTLAEQISHYIAKLTKVKGLDEINARRDAESIIKGKRMVEDGEYAILETTDDTSATLQYYVRKNEMWVLDDTIDAETFADSMKMFCNLNEKCIEVKNTCQDETTGASEIKKHNLKLLLSEFDTKLNVNKDVISNKIEDELGIADARIEKLRNLRLTKLYKYEAAKIVLGNMSEETMKIVISPYDGLLNTIMSQADIAKRYLDISKFVNAFTREGNIDNAESPHWLYCIKTNKRMLPLFIYKLASIFLNGGDYAYELNKICAQQGSLSDDGDKWIDKYSGYTIKMIELNADEEYNEEGFKIITHAVAETDIGDIITQGLPKGKEMLPKKYITADANKIYNIIDAMSTNMGINIEDQKDFIVRNVLKQLTNTSVLPPKVAYEKVLAKAIAANKPMDTYENAYNSILIYLTLSYYLIAIQLSVPPIKTKVTFPGCKRSFSGFPVDGTDDSRGMTYVACVAHKIKSSASLPWSSIQNRSAAQIVKQMEVTITKFILPTEEIQNGIKEVKLYMATNTDLSIPEEYNVENWNSFLPPLKKIKMATHSDVGEVFKTRLIDSIRKASGTQQDYINELHSKMIMFSFNIIELIEKTINGEQALLQGNTGKPFLENACCDSGENVTIQYFIKKEPEIAILNNKVVRLSDMYDDTKKMTKASLLYDPSNTKRKLRDIGTKFSEETIYRAFIVYCRFNSLTPLSDTMKAICPTKPDNFNMDDTLEESIRKLKSSARNYNENSLEQLLNVVNTKSQTSINVEEVKLTNRDKLTEIITKIDEENVRSSVFRKAFLELIENFEINTLMEDTASLRQMKNLLAKLNEDMQRQIIGIAAETGSTIKGANLKKFRECIETIVQFEETGSRDETGYKMVNFMKKTMRSLTKEFPNIIMNAIDYKEHINIPTHWELSAKHQSDVKNIMIDHYTELNKYYKDKQIILLMKKFTETTNDMNELAQNTLFYTPVQIKAKRTSSAEGSTEKYSAFDLDLTTALFKFYLFNILTDLIGFQQDAEILHLPLNELQESSSTDDEEKFLSKVNDAELLVGNRAELTEKIVNVMVTFMKLICKDKSAINYNYKSLMELILRSKEKEKDDITDYLKDMNDEENEIEKEFKMHKLGRWSKGEQKGFHAYQPETYDEERDDMEKMALKEVKLNKRNVVTDMNRDIFRLDMIAEDADNEAMDREDNLITDLGEDAEYEDFDMDGDERY